MSRGRIRPLLTLMLAQALRARLLRAGARLVARLAVDFLAAVLRAGAFLAVRLRAGAFLAVRLRAVDLRAGDFLAVRLAVDFLAVDLRAVAFLAARFRPVDFLADFLAVDLRAGALFVVRLAVDFRAAVLRAGAFLAERFRTAFLTAIASSSLGFNADLNAEPVANRTPFDAGIGTTAPVRGLRPTRGPRSIGLNEPNPTTVTFRPDRTSEMITPNRVSTKSSTARRDDDVVSLTARTS